MPRSKFCLGCLSLALLAACSTPSKPVPALEVSPTPEIQAPVPDWYSARALDASTAKYLALGYGSGASLEAARNEAIKEIAQRIQINVESNSSAAAGETRDGDNLSYWSKSDSELFVRSSAKLSGLDLLKQELAGGTYYVAMTYDLRSLPVRIAAAGCNPEANAAWSAYAQASRLGQQLRESGCSAGWQLRNSDGIWFVDYAGTPFVLPSNELPNLLFANSKQAEFALDLQPSTNLKNGDFYHLNLSNQNPGYLSIFHVDQFGNTQMLVANEYQDSAGSLTFPNLEDYDGLIAFTNKGVSGYSQDLLLATLCPKADPRLEEHLPVAERDSNLLDSSTRRFGQLLDDIRDCVVASARLNIQPS